MIRNTFFSMSRFVCLCRKEIAENAKACLRLLVVGYAVLVFIMVFNAYNTATIGDSSIYWRKSIAPIYIMAIVFWGMSSSLIMKWMRTKTGRINTLMIPATSFEKYFSHWMFFMLNLLIILVTCKLADLTSIGITSLIRPNFEISSFPFLSYLVGEAEHWTIFENTRYILLFASSMLFMQSCFVLGGTIWTSKPFLKTIGAICAIVFGYFLLVLGLVELIDFHLWVSPHSDYEIALPAIIVISLVTIVNWVLAYYRFKESEIINRW